MLSDKVRERLAETLVDRIEELNTTILEEIGKSIKTIGGLTTSQAYQLIQQLKYGASYRKIIKKLAEVSNLNERQIKEIFEAIAKQDQNFAKQFYQYRDIDFIPYERNDRLKRQVNAISKLTVDTFTNMMNSSAFITIENGKQVVTPLSRIYQHILDRAILSLSQGRESYGTIMRKAMRELADNGIRTIDYASGTHRRLDSAVRMNLLDGMRNLSNEMQKSFGEEFGADGVEVSVHSYPAEDHADIQGRQFTNENWEKLQAGERVKDYSGTYRQIGHSKSGGYRPISEYNCYHGITSVILGVNKPIYSESQLNDIQNQNEKGFKFEGKQYTLYEGTQLQRQIETKVRTLKDRQIGAKARGDWDEVRKCQLGITQLTHKYKELCDVSGLPSKATRMSVSGYKRTKIPA